MFWWKASGPAPWTSWDFPAPGLEELNPGLIHVAVSGWGQGGPYRLRAGHDLNYMALGGGLAASGAGGVPVMSYPPVADHSAAIQAVAAVSAALFRRSRTGQGRLSRHQPDGNRSRLAIMAADHGATRTTSPSFGRPADRWGRLLSDLPHGGRSIRQPGCRSRKSSGRPSARPSAGPTGSAASSSRCLKPT